MGRPLKITKSVASAISGNTLKVGEIGSSLLAGNQIEVAFKTGGTAYAGWIANQKSTKGFTCTDGTHTAKCFLVDKASGSLANGEMSITATKSDTTTFRVAKITKHKLYDFSGAPWGWTFGAASTGIVTLAQPTLTITTTYTGAAHGAVSQQLATTGGTSPYTYAVTVGTLPTGLTLSSSGLLSGTSVAEGPIAFTVTVTDALGNTGTKAFSVTYT
jgi:hypothetical protein